MLKRQRSPSNTRADDGNARGNDNRHRQQQLAESDEQPERWPVYFPATDWQPDLHSPIIRVFQAFFSRSTSTSTRPGDDHKGRVLSVDYSDLCLHLSSTPALIDQLRIQPSLILSLLALSADLVLKPLSKLSVRLQGYTGNSIQMRNLKANLIGNLVSIHGTIVKASSVRPMITQLAFACSQCSEVTVVDLREGRYAMPSGKCPAVGCKSRSFVALRDSHLTRAIDSQRVRIQESLMVSS
eukprot:Partr_v1_DN23777_c1_g1_i1_m52997 putative minichromosome maintenance complex component 8